MSSAMPLIEPWQNYYRQIENAADTFWKQASFLAHGRIQTLAIWERLQKIAQELVSQLFARTPLTEFETFLLSAAALLYESGWQAPGGAEATGADRYRLSGLVIRQSYLRQARAFNLGLADLDSTTVNMLASICEALGQEDLFFLSGTPVAAGYQQTARPRYLAALLQLADALLVPRQKEAFFHKFRIPAHFNEEADARLALHPYIVQFALAPGHLTTHIEINPVDKDYAQRIAELVEMPIRRWWASNWRWLVSEFQADLTLAREIHPPGLLAKTLLEVSPALPAYLAVYQPVAPVLPTAGQVREAREQAARGPVQTRPSGASASREQEETSEPAEQYDDFHLHIDRQGHILARSRLGEARDICEIKIPATIGLSCTLFAQNVKNTTLCQDLGRLLYEYIFPKDIHTLFQKTEAVAESNQRKTRIRLDIEAETLARLPLEFLYREDRGVFLAIDPRTALSRYLQVAFQRSAIRRGPGPLHMLLIISSPRDQAKLNIDEWQEAVTQALAEPLKQQLLTLDCVPIGTYAAINRAILQCKPNIIQFVGHGIYKNETSSLALMKEDGNTWLIDGVRFADIFLTSLDHLGLFCLASCESATSDNPQGFLGVTPQLLQRGVPAVIAMQYSIKISTARLFFSQLYQSVAYHKPIDWAVQQARNAISAQSGRDNREFATPVLYMRAEDGRIF